MCLIKLIIKSNGQLPVYNYSSFNLSQLMENATSTSSYATAFDLGPLMHSIVYMRHILRQHSGNI